MADLNELTPRTPGEAILNLRQQGKALIELLKSISFLGTWPKNRLPGLLIGN